MTEQSSSKADSTPRKRALVSCDRCKIRRARCIRSSPGEPCSDCKASGVQCESKLPRKQRVYGSVETLSLRYRALECLVKGLFPQDNTQDTNVLFELAATQKIPMPASDDFTPAPIFNNEEQKTSSTRRHSIFQSLQHAPKSPLASVDHVQPVDTPFAPTTTTVGSQPPEEKFPSDRKEELIRTRHGVPHYFGPSSAFRLATAVRELVGRYKAASGYPTGLRKSSSSLSDAMAKSTDPSAHHSASDEEEYTITGTEPEPEPVTIRNRRERKRSRSQMEETEREWKQPGNYLKETIGSFLPSKALARALVSAYFKHIHIYFPMFHQVIFESRLEEMYLRERDLVKDYSDTGWLVCLALVFSFGCEKLPGNDPEGTQRLRWKYLAFSKAHFRHLLTTTCLVNVQALLLLNTHHHIAGQMSSSWLVIGLAARMVSHVPVYYHIAADIHRQLLWVCIETFQTQSSTQSSAMYADKPGGRFTFLKRYWAISWGGQRSLMTKKCPSGSPIPLY
jgi:proline utilization trans-activator